MSYSTALLILAAVIYALVVSYLVAISAYAPDAITTDMERAWVATAVGAIVTIAAVGTALRLGGL